jgi:hypothetical protein
VSANLPEAHYVNVRQRVADNGVGFLAMLGTLKPHQALIGELGNGALKINRALQLCQSPRPEQLEEFIRYSEKRTTSRIIRRSMQPRMGKSASMQAR